jgi:hypothetical protein
MNEMLKEVKGRRLPLDQPSHTTETFDRMRYILVNKIKMRRNSTYTDDINCHVFEIGHFSINGSRDGGLPGDFCVSDFGIEIRYEAPKGRAFNKAKRLGDSYQSMLSSERHEGVPSHKSQ